MKKRYLTILLIAVIVIVGVFMGQSFFSWDCHHVTQ